MTKKLLIFLLLILVSLPAARAQTEQTIEKSEIIENINGKDYYLHFVEKGETLFGIAAAYGLRVDDIFKENPQSRKGIYPGIVLKIPVIQASIQGDNNPKENEGDSFYYHIVQKQETYYGIAKKYNISVEQLKALNKDAGAYLKEGQSLKVPALKKEETPSDLATENKITHKVKKGESLYGIARQYNVTLGQLYNLNPGLDDHIDVGDQIFIPAPEIKKEQFPGPGDQEAQEPKKVHSVKAGETLYSIARDYAVSIDTLFYYNPELNRQGHIRIGQEIILPSSKNTQQYIVHKSEKKESLDKISEMYQVEYEKIVKMNPDIKRKAKKGQAVKIPVEPSLKAEEVTENESDSGFSEPTPCDSAYHPNARTFNVALMLPFFLEELDSIPDKEKEDLSSLESFKSLRFLNFYAGFQMALDSMKARGMQVNVFVYDVDNSEEKTAKVLHASELSAMDLIVGPFFGRSFAAVADFARTYEIPIVNPLSQREEIIIDNPWVFKIKPSEEFQQEQLIAYVLKNYPGQNIILVRNNKYKYQSEISFIRNSINRSRPGHQYLNNAFILNRIKNLKDKPKSLLTENKLFKTEYLEKNLSDSSFVSNMVKEVNYVDDSARGLAMNLSMLRRNIVIALSDDIVFSKDLVSQLNKLSLDYEITLFGLPDWMSFPDMETNHLLSLNFHCFSSSIVNYNDDTVKEWIRRYRNRFHTEPAGYNYAIDGFDVGWYFLNALYRFGPSFYSCTQSFYPGLIQNDYHFKQKPMSGYQNTHWNIGCYKNYRLVKVSDEGKF